MAENLPQRLQAALGPSFAIERELGGGGMSRVYLVADAALARRIVVKILPPDLAPRISELTAGQLVALRFASDEEIPELTRKVLDEKIRNQDDIKRMIRSWRPDHLRV